MLVDERRVDHSQVSSLLLGHSEDNEFPAVVFLGAIKFTKE